MSNVFIRLNREELQSFRCTPLQKSKLEEFEELFKRSLIRIHMVSPDGRESFAKAIAKIIDDVDILARLRAAKIMLGSPIPPDTYDSSILSAFSNLLDAEKALLSPVYIKHHERRLGVFEKDCVINGEKYRRGDIVLLTVEQLIIASIQKCFKPMHHPLLGIIPQQK